LIAINHLTGTREKPELIDNISSSGRRNKDRFKQLFLVFLVPMRIKAVLVVTCAIFLTLLALILHFSAM